MTQAEGPRVEQLTPHMVRVVVGGRRGVWAPDQAVEVVVKLAVGGGATMAWAARCTASAREFASVNAALEYAARCAIDGGTRR